MTTHSRSGLRSPAARLPGADHPLFEVPPGLMGFGMGVHGEPGVSERSLSRPPPRLRVELFDLLLDERPAGSGNRVVALLNGLGATKYEELFLLWGEVHDRLTDARLEIVAPAVGELITSLNMAGLSLTLCWLDPELEALWTAPGASPAFTSEVSVARGVSREVQGGIASHALQPTTSAEAAAQAAKLATVADGVLDALRAAEEELGALDAVAGDGDHGLGMVRGAAAAAEAAHRAVDAGAGPASTLREAAAGWEAKSGGTSGALWGAMLLGASEVLADDRPIDVSDVVPAVTAARDTLVRMGGAEVGDKTMLDALQPFVESLSSLAEPAGLEKAWRAFVEAARAGC